jgi:hypothetical protein
MDEKLLSEKEVISTAGYIIAMAMNEEALRDEIYCVTMKQVTNNPSK